MISLGEIEIAEVEGMATCREYSINAEYLSFISQLLFIIIVIIYLFLLFFFITRSFRASLCAPRLILRPTEHPARPLDR
jgi:hypothetical protein